jgi:hypothetical protein
LLRLKSKLGAIQAGLANNRTHRADWNLLSRRRHNDGSPGRRAKFNVAASLGDAGKTVAFQDRDYLG